MSKKKFIKQLVQLKKEKCDIVLGKLILSGLEPTLEPVQIKSPSSSISLENNEREKVVEKKEIYAGPIEANFFFLKITDNK